MSITGELLSKATKVVAHRNLTAGERRAAVRLVEEGKLVAHKKDRFIYYSLPK